MSSKRFFQSEFDLGSNSKRQKTDQPGNNEEFKLPPIKKYSIPSTSRSKSPPPKVQIPSNNDDLWGDVDIDDDLILVASQVEETYTQQQGASQMNISRMNCSYSGFVQKIPSFSTQKSKPVVVDTDYPEDFLKALDILSDLENSVNNPGPGPSTLKPLKPTIADRQQNQDQNSQKENSKDVQIKHLAKKIKFLEAINEQLKKNNITITTKCQTKEGEATNLRNEVRAIKQQNHQQKMQKITENEHLKNSWVQEKKDYQKAMESLRAELEMAKMEATTSKLNTSKTVVNKPYVKVSSLEKLDVTNFESRNILKLREIEIDPRIFDIKIEEFKESFSISLKDRIMYNLLFKLQTDLAKMQIEYKELGLVNDDVVNEFYSSACYFIKNLENYVNQLKSIECATHGFTFLSQNYYHNQINYLNSPETTSISQMGPLFYGEQAVFVRRILVIFSIVSQHSSKFSMKILQELIDNHSFVNILGNCLNLLSYSNDLFNFSGVVTASADLLLSLVLTYSQKNDEPLFNLFQSIVFCRPDCPLVLRKLSSFLLAISKNQQAAGIINRLCCSSSSNDFVSNERYKMIQFRNNSCVLQVYGALLEVVFKSNEMIKDYEVELLLDLTENTVQFFRNCVRFGKTTLMLPCRLIGVLEGCNCYLKLTDAVIGLLFLCFKNCIPKIDQYRSRLIPVLQTGIFTLSDVMTINSLMNQVNCYGHDKKNRLMVVCDSFKSESKSFNYQQVHDEALRPIQMTRLRLPEADDGEKSKKKNDNSFLYFFD